MAWLSGVGIVFAVLTAPMLLIDLWRTLTGQIQDADLVMVQESEDLTHVHAPDARAPAEPSQRTRP